MLYIQGDRVRRMQSWRIAGEYHSAGGRRLEAGELAEALPLLYGTLPTLQPQTSLQDATQGIDPDHPPGDRDSGAAQTASG